MPKFTKVKAFIKRNQFKIVQHGIVTGYSIAGGAVATAALFAGVKVGVAIIKGAQNNG